jgi:uncharacterized protein (TIGR02145 family)
MKMFERVFKVGYTAAIFLLMFCCWNCHKEQVTQKPILVTYEVTNIKSTTVDCGGKITSEGSSPVSSRGVCWSVNQNPTIKFKDSITSDGAGAGSFNSTFSGLKYGIKYYIRAYASSGAGTSYGNQVTAILPPVLATVTTSPVIAINATTIKSGGNITADGGSPILFRGVVLSSRETPILENVFPSDGGGSGSFTCSVTDLDPDSVYYLRAYATNQIGTSYGKEFSFSISKMLVKDVDGNYYRHVTIGAQVWMTENLKTTRFRDSTSIPLVEDILNWSSRITHGYCWYNNDESMYKEKYGAIYNWYTVSTGKLCPTGWHVPSESDWVVLTNYLGGTSRAGGSLKELGISHWKNPNAGATNETGFTARPGGYRMSTGEFGNEGIYGNWWSATTTIANVANYRSIYYGNTILNKSFISQKSGLSVRCVKN